MPSRQRDQTVFIVGAGASKELNLPTGEELKKIIANKLNFNIDSIGNYHGGDVEIRSALISKSQEDAVYKDWLSFAKLTRDVMPLAPSIDNFLDVHSGNRVIEFCGKVAIVKSIIEAEKASTLYFDSRSMQAASISFNQCENTWLNALAKKLSTSCPLSELPSRLKGITFIIFNYDRCVEHFLYHAIMKYYNISSENCAEILSNLTVFHPYGSVGTLPWRKYTNPTPFGESLSPSELTVLSNGIKTFTEGTSKSSSEIESMRSSAMLANRLIIMGFGFHEINMNFLFPKNIHKRINNRTRVFGTASGQSSSDTADIVHTLSVRLQVPSSSIFIRNDKKCHELFHEYNRLMSFK